MNSQLSPPLPKGHSSLLLEQSSQSALARTDLAAQLSQRSDIRQILLDQSGHCQEAIIMRLRQVQGLFTGDAQLVDGDEPKPVRALLRALSGSGQCKQRFPSEGSRGQDCWVRAQGPNHSFRQEDDPHIGLPVSTMLVLEPCRNPDDSVRWGDPRSVLGHQGEDPGSRIHQMPEIVGMSGSAFIMAEQVDQLGTHRFVAEFVHCQSVYRFPAEAKPV